MSNQRQQLVNLFSDEKVLFYAPVAESKDASRAKQVFSNPEDEEYKLVCISRIKS
jgi:hypothetical protein